MNNDTRENHEHPFKVDKERAKEYTNFIKSRKTNNQALAETFIDTKKE